jgi:hypothetical protein
MILQGKAYWAKVLGNPQDGYTKGEREWSVDIGVDEKAVEKYLAEGGSDFYLKSKDNHPANGQYLAFKRKEIKQDGTPAKPIEVVDNKGNPWDKSVKIGNGSTVNFKFALNEVTVAGKTRLKPSLIGLQVWEHVPFEGNSDEYQEYPSVDNEESWV